MAKLNIVKIPVDYDKPVINGHYSISESASVVELPPGDPELLGKVLEVIDASPENWDQTDYAVRDEGYYAPNGDLISYNYEDRENVDYNATWLPDVVVDPIPACGTALCVAGHAVTQKGYHIVFAAGNNNSRCCVDDTGQRYDISFLATQLLGISTYDANILFAGNNDREDLERFRNQLDAGEHLDEYEEDYQEDDYYSEDA